MWETVFNVVKILGAFGALVTGIIVVARLWSGAIKDQLIHHLKSELGLCRDHSAACDKTVEHYRTEVHDIRDECNGTVAKALLETNTAKEALKSVEIENASLRARTDLSPVMSVMTEFMKEQREFIKDQTQINGLVLGALQRLAPTLIPIP